MVFRKLERFAGRSAVKTWVLAITMRVVSNHIRMRRRKGAAHALTSVELGGLSVAEVARELGANVNTLQGRSQSRSACAPALELTGLAALPPAVVSAC
jgi:DNA-directed RNA polymerase specialized sigma24 family protein